MKYVWIFLLLAGCTSYSETRTSSFPFHAEGNSTINVYIEGVDVATSRQTGQEATSEADLKAALSQAAATAVATGREAILEDTLNKFKAEANQANSNNDNSVVPAPVVTPSPTVPVVIPPSPVIEEDNKTEPPATPVKQVFVLIEGEYRGRTDDNRPTWNFSRKLADYPKSFKLSIPGCYEGMVNNDGERWNTPDNKYVVKQSDKLGWRTAVFGPAECKSEKANINYYIQGE